MTRTRISLTAAGILAGALAVQGLVLWLWGTGFEVVGFGLNANQLLSVNLFWSLLTSILHYAAFGLGVFVTIGFLAPIEADSTWRRTITRGVIATIVGAIAALALSLLVSLVAAVAIGAYPLGYSFSAAVDPSRVTFGIQNALAGALTPLVGWLPLTVLGCVFLKLWLIAHPASPETKARASVSASSVSE
jgi:hypothetical protein